MDKNKAWNQFVQSGTIYDYLSYCKEQDFQDKEEVNHDNNHTRASDSRNGLWRP